MNVTGMKNINPSSQTKEYKEQAELLRKKVTAESFFQSITRVSFGAKKEHVLFEKEKPKNGAFGNKTLAEAPDEVKDAWNKAEKESGVNGMAMDSEGKLTHLTQLFVMSFESSLHGGRRDILGNTVYSARSAVQNALNRLEIPRNREEEKEKLFYEAFLRYLS